MKYGALAKGVSGASYYICPRRSDADRVRALARGARKAGIWTGRATLNALIDLGMNDMRTAPISQVYAVFKRNRK